MSFWYYWHLFCACIRNEYIYYNLEGWITPSQTKKNLWFEWITLNRIGKIYDVCCFVPPIYTYVIYHLQNKVSHLLTKQHKGQNTICKKRFSHLMQNNLYIIHILKGPNWFILMNKKFEKMWSQTYFLALCISTKNNKPCECFALIQKDERCQKIIKLKNTNHKLDDKRMLVL